MATGTFSFEDAQGPAFVPAKRTSKVVDDQEDNLPVTSDKAGTLPSNKDTLNIIKEAAARYGVPEEYGLALADQESGYDPSASNSEFGAAGLYQFIPDTAKRLGIDPRDPKASADAAMKEFAAQMQIGGVDWAIKHHFAGPNLKGHGRKTRQYLADVQKRASDIKGLLGLPSGDEAVDVGGMSDEGPKPAMGTFSFEEGGGPAGGPERPVAAALPEDNRSFLSRTGDYAEEAISKSYNYVKNRLLTDLGQIPVDSPDYTPRKGAPDPFAETRDVRARIERRKAGEALPAGKKGFWANIDNPVKLLTQDSLPANAVEALVNAPEHERTRLMDARKVMMQQKILDNPEQYPKVAVDAAKSAQAQREAKQDPNVREMWDQLRKAFKADPGGVGAQFANALIADPEMLLVPEGLGLRVAAGTKAITSGKTVGRALEIADKIVDTATAGAALNLGMEEVNAASQGRNLTPGEAGFAVASGAGLGGIFGAFSRGGKAKAALAEGNVTADTLEGALRYAAQEEIVTERVINTPGVISKNTRHAVEEAAGIKFESDSDLKQYLMMRRKEWKQLFADRDLNGQYQKYLANERVSTADQLANDRTERAQAQEDAAKQAADVEKAYAQRAGERAQELQQNYDQALAAAQDTKNAQIDDAFKLQKVTDDLDQQEILDAAFEGEGQVRNAMLRAAQRDSKLATPKWQRGEIDPRLLARLGVGSLFAGTAYAVAPEQKAKTAFAAGLAGLLIPGGGRVLDRMRQSGAVSLEGDIVGLLAKEGKLKLGKSAEEIKSRDVELINLAKNGDQRAYKELYQEYFPKIQRYVKSFVRDAGPRLGVDAEDVAQEAFVKAFQNLDKFEGTSQFTTWLHSIARNEGLMAIRDAKTLKGGGEFDIGSADLPDVRTPFGETYSRDVFEEGAGTQMEDNPQANLEMQQSQEALVRAIEKLPERERKVFVLSKVEQLSGPEIAEATGLSLENVWKILTRTTDQVLADVEKGMGAKKLEAGAKLQAGAQPEMVKRGRGRPRKQAGEIDPELLKTVGTLALGAGGGLALEAYMRDKGDKQIGTRQLMSAVVGSGLLLFAGKGGGLRGAAKFAEDTLGAASTRILNKSPAIHRRIQTAERRMLETAHEHLGNVDPFLHQLKKLPESGRGILTRALMTGKGAVIDRILTAMNDPVLTASYKSVRKTLDSLGDQLVGLKRFSRGNIEYFPRIVKDKEGLFNAIGKEEAGNLQAILQDANVESLRKHGRPLSEIEESAIINQALFVDKRSTQPSWAKNRGIEEITPELQKFYASPEEALHSYIRAATQDIEAAKFFGGAATNMKKGAHEFLDVDRSVKNMMAEEVKSGKLSDTDAAEIADILRTRFKEGLRGENEFIRNVKNIGNIGLLGNFFSAATQLADVGTQVYVQGLKPTLESVVRQITGRKLTDVKDFGLVDHISEEFAGQLRTSRWLNQVFRKTLFSHVDQFGKNTALNAAIIKAKSLASSDSGVAKLANKYEEAFGKDFTKLVSDLKGGKITELTKDYAFMELARTQPISRIEMPLAYLKHPNLRSYLWLKSFAMKQMDLVRRDAYNEMRKGNIGKGMKNLAEIGVVLGVSGATTDMVKDFMLGKDVSLKGSDILVNMFKTFGFSEYMKDQFKGVSKEEATERRKAGDKYARAKSAEPISAIASAFKPPFQMFDQLLRADPRAIRYLVPFVGPYLAEQVKKENEMRASGGSK